MELLDGNKMEAVEFYAEFEKIVGCSEKKWIDKDTTKNDGGDDWWEYRDNSFVLGDTAYSAPKLFKIKKL